MKCPSVEQIGNSTNLSDNDIEFVMVTKDGPALPAKKPRVPSLGNWRMPAVVDKTVETYVETLALPSLGILPTQTNISSSLVKHMKTGR